MTITKICSRHMIETELAENMDTFPFLKCKEYYAYTSYLFKCHFSNQNNIEKQKQNITNY